MPNLSFSKDITNKNKQSPQLKQSNIKKMPANMILTPYPCFLYLEPNQNPENYVLINGKYYFNDYDKDGSYLRRQFGSK